MQLVEYTFFKKRKYFLRLVLRKIQLDAKKQLKSAFFIPKMKIFILAGRNTFIIQSDKLG